MKNILLLLIVCFTLVRVDGQSLIKDFPKVPQCQRILIDTQNAKLYTFGNFNKIGKRLGYAAPINLDGTIPDRWPQVNGIVNDAVSDNHGGWVIQGEFTQLDDYFVPHLARVTQDGRIDTSFPKINGYIESMIRYGDTLFLSGGGLYDVGTQVDRTRNLYVQNANTNLQEKNWNNIDGEIKLIKPDQNGGVIIWGNFTYSGNTSVKNFVHLDSSGNIIPSNVSIEGTVNDMILMNDTLFIAGNFSSVNNINRNNLVSMNIQSGVIYSPELNINNGVYQIEIFNQVIYALGKFTLVSNQTRKGLAAFSQPSFSLTSWSPNITPPVPNHFAITGNYLFCVGNTSTKSIVRINLSNADTQTTQLQSRSNELGTEVFNKFIVYNQTLYVTGNFDSLGFKTRQYPIIAINPVSNTQQIWFPGHSLKPNGRNGSYRFLKQYYQNGKILFANGNLLKFNDTLSASFFTYDLSTDSIVPIPLGMNIHQYYNGSYSGISIVFSNNRIFIGGRFDYTYKNFGGTLFAINLKTNEVSHLVNFNPFAYNPTLGLAFDGQKNLYLFGGFLKDTVSYNLCRYNTQTKILSFDHVPAWTYSEHVRDFFYYKNKLYVTLSNLLQSYDPVSKNLETLFTSDDYFDLTASALVNSTFFFSGSFTSVNGIARKGIAAYNLDAKIITGWNPGFYQPYKALGLAYCNNQLYACNDSHTQGDPNTFTGSYILNMSTGKAQDFSLSASDEIKKIRSSSNQLFYIGSFSGIGGSNADSVAEIDLTNFNITRFERTNISLPPNLPQIDDVAMIDSFLFIFYTKVDEQKQTSEYTYKQLNRFTKKLAVPQAKLPTNIGEYKIYKFDNKVYIAGYFDTVQSMRIQRIIRYDYPSFKLDTSWSMTLDGWVNSMFKVDSLIYVCGSFNTIKQQPRNHIAAFNPVTKTLSPFKLNIGTAGGINEALVRNNKIFITGWFELLSNQQTYSFADYNLNTNTLTPLQGSFTNLNALTLSYFKNHIIFSGDFTFSYNNKTYKNFVGINSDNYTVNEQFSNYNPYNLSLTDFGSYKNMVVLNHRLSVFSQANAVYAYYDKYSSFDVFAGQNIMCAGSDVNVSFQSSDTTSYTLQLSDNKGDFKNAATIATFNNTQPNTTPVTIPDNAPYGKKYQFRLVDSYKNAYANNIKYTIWGHIHLVDSITGSNTVQAGINNVLSVPKDSNITNYRWTIPQNWSIVSGQGTNQISVLTNSDSGLVSVIRSNTCFTDSFSVQINPLTTALRELEHPNITVLVFPNPNNGRFSITSSETIESISIFSMEGKWLKDLSVNSTRTDITLEAKGLFIIRVISANGISQKLISIE